MSVLALIEISLKEHRLQLLRVLLVDEVEHAETGSDMLWLLAFHVLILVCFVYLFLKFHNING